MTVALPRGLGHNRLTGGYNMKEIQGCGCLLIIFGMLMFLLSGLGSALI
jgi:hypothetical protein